MSADPIRDLVAHLSRPPVARATIEHTRLCELLAYDPGTGEFTWKVSHAHAPKGSIAGSIMAGGYRHVRVGGETHYAHRLAWFYVHGKWPSAQIDHINRIPADNRIANLREATQSQNNANTKERKDNTSGQRGVSFCKSNSKWQAEIGWQGERTFLGYYDSLEAARAAYADAARRLHGTFTPRAKIEHEADPQQPNRIAYRVSGPTRESVQVVIDNLFASVEHGFGYANFVGPSRGDGEFFALGQVVIYSAEFA